MELFNSVKEKFFSSPGIEAKETTEGLKIKEDGTLILGCMAGPSQEISNLFHEMGHLIVCPDKKVGMYAWGLDYSNIVYIPGYQPFIEPLTCQDVLLELKVIGWQAVIEKELTGDIKGSLDNVRALTWLGGWSYYKYEETKDLEYSKKDNAKIEFGQQFIQDFLLKVTFQDFQQEWDRKIKLVEEKMFTMV